MSKRKNRLLSIVVPAYKQEQTIEKDLKSIIKTLDLGLPIEVDFEVICVVDGSLDKTEANARKIKSKNLRVYSYKVNQGKGHAVRHGMSKAGGDLVSFLDAGMDISPKGIMMLLAHMEWYGADVVVGSKRHPVSRVNYPLFRHILSVGYHYGIKFLFGLKLTDTQSGIKIFRREVVDKILPRLLVKRYAMDIEMLAVAKYLGFKRIYEAPIEVKFEKGESSIGWQTIFNMAWDTAAVFYRLKLVDYYNYKNRKNWLR